MVMNIKSIRLKNCLCSKPQNGLMIGCSLSASLTSLLLKRLHKHILCVTVDFLELVVDLWGL